MNDVGALCTLAGLTASVLATLAALTGAPDCWMAPGAPDPPVNPERINPMAAAPAPSVPIAAPRVPPSTLASFLAFFFASAASNSAISLAISSRLSLVLAKVDLKALNATTGAATKGAAPSPTPSGTFAVDSTACFSTLGLGAGLTFSGLFLGGAAAGAAFLVVGAISFGTSKLRVSCTATFFPPRVFLGCSAGAEGAGVEETGAEGFDFTTFSGFSTFFSGTFFSLLTGFLGSFFDVEAAGGLRSLSSRL